ncbi:hypothetical protein M9H77_22357 [Catharanthus roseus]|uniref:Uncharacterized protein n=1 Tax=Catharanthus roseus TaxID=4058 RepID=A0ACC0AR64_CATRO|nr:hypothetical protein M9H77_22357 [Catharanthus roseus]
MVSEPSFLASQVLDQDSLRMSGSRQIDTAILDDDDHFHDHKRDWPRTCYLISDGWTVAVPGSSSPATHGWATTATSPSILINHGWESHSLAVHSPVRGSQRRTADLDSTDKRQGVTASASASSSFGTPGLSAEQWSSFLQLLNSQKNANPAFENLSGYWSNPTISPYTCFYNKCWATGDGPTAKIQSMSWSSPIELQPYSSRAAQVKYSGVGQSTLPDTAQLAAPSHTAHTQVSAGLVQIQNQEENRQTNSPTPKGVSAPMEDQETSSNLSSNDESTR